MNPTFLLTLSLAALLLIGCTSTHRTCGPGRAESDDSASVERELAALPRQWMEAYQRRDTKALDRLLADSFTSLTLAGSRSTKAELLRDLETSQFAWTTVDDVRVRNYREFAVVTFRSTGKVKAGEEEIPLEMLSSVQYHLRSPGHWEATSAQHMMVHQAPLTAATRK